MENFYFNNPSSKVWSNIIILWSIIILVALVSCKSRKLEKESYTLKDQSSTSVRLNKSDQTQDDSSKVKKSNSVTETKTDEESGAETTITTEYFEPSATIPPGSPKRKEEKSKESKKKHEEARSELNDSTYEFANHSKITEVDSTFQENKDIKQSSTSKNLKAEPNTLKNWIGAALFFIILGAAAILGITKGKVNSYFI